MNLWQYHDGIGVRACAWCMEAMGVDLSKAESHGICPAHMAHEIATLKARKVDTARLTGQNNLPVLVLAEQADVVSSAASVLPSNLSANRTKTPVEARGSTRDHRTPIASAIQPLVAGKTFGADSPITRITAPETPASD